MEEDFMQIEELKTFLTLCELKNFTHTAVQLSMSQPTVSLHIKNLEQEFQTTLFQRSSKRLSITPSGEILLERAKQILQIFENVKQQIAEHHETVQGELKIGASYTIGEYILPMILSEVKKKYPHLTLQITIGNTREIVESLKFLQIDVGLIEGTTNEKDLLVTPFMEDELVIVCAQSHPLTNEELVTIPQLQNQDWIIREVGSGTGEYLQHVLNQHAVKVKSLTRISSTQGIKECVINNLGISLLSKNTIRRELQLGVLKELKLDRKPFIRTFSIINSPIIKNRQTVQAFLEQIEKVRNIRANELV
jgi:LysR family transcriptional regulator, transcriptional activator of the cysJI operon